VAYASEHGRLPSDVWQEFCEHPRDYEILFAFDNWRAEEQEKARQRARQQAG
jgi:hypothetical protein